MPGIWLPNSGVNRKVKGIPLADLSGVQRKTKTGWLGVNGVNRKIFSGYDCRASNLTPIYGGIKSDGSYSATCPGYSGSASFSPIPLTHFIFDQSILFIKNSPIVVIKNASCYSSGNSTDCSFCTDASCLNSIANCSQIANVSACTLTFTATETISVSELWLGFESTTPYTEYDLSWAPGCMTIGGIQLKNIELI